VATEGQPLLISLQRTHTARRGASLSVNSSTVVSPSEPTNASSEQMQCDRAEPPGFLLPPAHQPTLASTDAAAVDVGGNGGVVLHRVEPRETGVDHKKQIMPLAGHGQEGDAKACYLAHTPSSTPPALRDAGAQGMRLPKAKGSDTLPCGTRHEAQGLFTVVTR
jgi:hypothetical protein